MTYNFDLGCYKHLRERMFEFHFNMYPFAFNYRENRFFVAALQKKNDWYVLSIHFFVFSL